MFNLGWAVKDKITGFQGTVVGRVEYISGCNQLLIVPTVDPTSGAYRSGE